jgi:acyl dehydratase
MTQNLRPSSVSGFHEFNYGPVTPALLRDYADASGDHNAIHLDADVARAKGLPGVIAHGMLIAGWMATRAERVVTEEWSRQTGQKGAPPRVRSFSSRFKAMTFLGDTVKIRVSLGAPIDGSLEVTLEAIAIRANSGEEVITTQGRMTFVGA